MWQSQRCTGTQKAECSSAVCQHILQSQRCKVVAVAFGRGASWLTCSLSGCLVCRCSRLASIQMAFSVRHPRHEHDQLLPDQAQAAHDAPVLGEPHCHTFPHIYHLKPSAKPADSVSLHGHRCDLEGGSTAGDAQPVIEGE